MNVFPRLDWDDLPALLWALIVHAWGELTNRRLACTVGTVGQHDGFREISLRPNNEGLTPAPKRSDPPAVKIWALAGQRLENIVLILAVTAGWLHFHACSFEQWSAVVGVACGLAAFGPRLGEATRGPQSLGALIAHWWRR